MMFELAFDTIAAFGNMLFLLGALAFFGFGGVMIAGWAWPRMTYKKFPGTIVGVVEKEARLKRGKKNGDNTIYYPLIEYIDENGTTIRARANSGSSLLSDKKTGKVLTIYVDPRDPQNIQIGGWGLLLIGSVFGAPGFLFLKPFIAGFEPSLPALIAFVLFSLLLVTKGLKLFKGIKRDKPLTMAEFETLKREQRQEERKQDIVLTESEVAEKIEEKTRQYVYVAPFVILVGLAMFCGGGYWAYTLNTFMQGAQRVEGRVIDMKDSYSDGSYTYYPVVEFEKPDGGKSSFTDNIGTNPPSYERGENVTVLYNPKFPYKPMIDRGIWNWVFQTGLCALGFLILVSGLAAARRRNSQAL